VSDIAIKTAQRPEIRLIRSFSCRFGSIWRGFKSAALEDGQAGIFGILRLLPRTQAHEEKAAPIILNVLVMKTLGAKIHSPLKQVRQSEENTRVAGADQPSVFMQKEA
jgi:hypothetical protein